MKRSLTLTLMVAVVGSLTVIGLTGTAVASGPADTSSDGVTATAVVNQDQTVQQSNTAAVDQEADQEAESGDSGINLEIDLDGDGNGGGGPGNPST